MFRNRTISFREEMHLKINLDYMASHYLGNWFRAEKQKSLKSGKKPCLTKTRRGLCSTKLVSIILFITVFRYVSSCLFDMVWVLCGWLLNMTDRESLYMKCDIIMAVYFAIWWAWHFFNTKCFTLDALPLCISIFRDLTSLIFQVQAFSFLSSMWYWILVLPECHQDNKCNGQCLHSTQYWIWLCC